VNADAANALDTTSGAGTATLNEDDIRQLPDDPDDLLQQLQLLASTGGGASTTANVVVDGFQNGSALPPKSSIKEGELVKFEMIQGPQERIRCASFRALRTGHPTAMNMRDRYTNS
jgi:hypothetical protein